MFRQKFKATLHFLGILSMRVFLGIVSGFFWLVLVAFLFRNVGAWIVEKLAYRDLDGSYNSMLEASQRYDSLNASIPDIVSVVAWIGIWLCLAAGVLWGFSQGKFDIRRWLRRRHA